MLASVSHGTICVFVLFSYGDSPPTFSQTQILLYKQTVVHLFSRTLLLLIFNRALNMRLLLCLRGCSVGRAWAGRNVNAPLRSDLLYCFVLLCTPPYAILTQKLPPHRLLVLSCPVASNSPPRKRRAARHGRRRRLRWRRARPSSSGLRFTAPLSRYV